MEFRGGRPLAEPGDESDVTGVMSLGGLHGLAGKGTGAQNDHVLPDFLSYIQFEILCSSMGLESKDSFKNKVCVAEHLKVLSYNTLLKYIILESVLDLLIGVLGLDLGFELGIKGKVT